MCSLTSRPTGEAKQSKRRSKRIRKRKQMESTSMDKSPSNLETSRKQIRTKTKRPKFLSLKLELSTSHEIEESPGATKNKKKKKKKHKPSKQSKTKGADTTPFEEKKRADTVAGGEKEEEQYETVAAYLFSSAATDSSMSSINDLLPSSAAHVDCSERKDLSPYDRGGSPSSSLLKTAMRKGASKEEETTEERWVSYSEVVEEVMSRSGTPRPDGKDRRRSLALKLDYEQVMEAWSDKGTLYVDGEPPQTVPDLHASAYVFTGGGDSGSLWTVPEMETTERLWRGHREASLLRYKEKRQNRLFSKRIRYEVRKLNAEKRPRVKGRFVKRDD